MYPITEVDDALMEFPADVTHLIPAYEDIPEEFKRYKPSKWFRLFHDWFYKGLATCVFVPKEGVDTMKACRQIRCVLGTYQIRHEHKEAAVVFLFNEWFTDADWTVKKKANL